MIQQFKSLVIFVQEHQMKGFWPQREGYAQLLVSSHVNGGSRDNKSKSRDPEE